MALYFFSLKDGKRTTIDREGTEFADLEAAQAHAAVIAREIMRNDSDRTLTWRLAVQDADRNVCFEVLFATVAERLEPLSAQARASITDRVRRLAGLTDDISAVRHTLRELRATLARAEGRPHLATIDGAHVGR